MSDPIRTYLDSVTNLDRVAATAKMQIAMVAQVAQALQRDPLHFMFSNTNIGMPEMPWADQRSTEANGLLLNRYSRHSLNGIMRG